MKVVEETPTKLTVQILSKSNIVILHLLGLLVVGLGIWQCFDAYNNLNVPNLQLSE